MGVRLATPVGVWVVLMSAQPKWPSVGVTDSSPGGELEPERERARRPPMPMLNSISINLVGTAICLSE